MIKIRGRDQRGKTEIDWLKARHSFSFGDYYDPAERGYSKLLVINDDWIAPGAGFPPHPHRNMEILTYVLEGAIEHRDSMGNHGTISAGELQRMTAGTGVVHSEYNPSPHEPLHSLQIWILPRRAGLTPSYEQRAIVPPADRPALTTIASEQAENGAITINTDAAIRLLTLAPRARVSYAPPAGRKTYLHVTRGALALGELKLAEGDGAKIEEEERLDFVGEGPAEALIFDLP